MASIAQQQLFVWSDIEKISGLERLKLILEALPDEELMRELEAERGPSGINKYPIRAVWNSILAGVIYGHATIESLRRELMRNPSLMQACGFPVVFGEEAVPSAGCYSRFSKKLEGKTEQLQEIFEALLAICFEELDGFGEMLAIDGKALASFANKKGKHGDDRRGDHEAVWGRHVHRNENSDGTITETIKKWFGYKLHLIADTRYELPIAFTVLPASMNEMPVAHKLLENMAVSHPVRLKTCRYFCGDRGYDDGKLHRKLWDEYGIKPIIDIRKSWKDGEETRAYEKAPGVVYSNKGEVFCVSYFGEYKRMAHRGFEKDRNCIKYRCPAKHYGISCRGEKYCTLPEQVRIPLSQDRRIFSPVARDSYKWKTLHKARTAVERVNSRIDTMFGFEQHTIRGLKKMHVRMSIALILQLAFAVGKIRQKKEDEIRQFLRAG